MIKFVGLSSATGIIRDSIACNFLEILFTFSEQRLFKAHLRAASVVARAYVNYRIARSLIFGLG